MKATVIRRVNTRLEANTSSRKLQPLEVGMVIDVVRIEFGEEIEGNNIWLVDKNNKRYSSRGFSYNLDGNLLSKFIDFPFLWSFTKGKKIKIGIYDSGVYKKKYPSLFEEERVIQLNHNDNEVIDFHGTYMATIIGGSNIEKGYVGFLPNALIYSYCCLDRENTAIIDKDDLINALNIFYKEEVDVINISMSTELNDTVMKNLFERDDKLNKLINKLREKNIIIVASTGNNRSSDDSIKNYPAALSDIFSVSGYRVENDNFVYENDADIWSSVKVLAPCFAIYNEDYFSQFKFNTKSGTSISCAILSGILGILKLKYCTNKIKEKLFYDYVNEIIQEMPIIEVNKGNLLNRQYKYLNFSNLTALLL
jgi:subtilisin family serine protease